MLQQAKGCNLSNFWATKIVQYFLEIAVQDKQFLSNTNMWIINIWGL